MTNKEKTFTEKKLNLILNLMDTSFFDWMYDEFKTRSFNSFDALDEFVDNELRKHYDRKDQIKTYFEEKYWKDFKEDESEEDFED